MSIVVRALRPTEARRLGRPVALVVALQFSTLLTLSPAPTTAQESEPESSAVPNLFGHVFVIPVMVRTPFARTSVRNTIGIGKASDINFGDLELPNGDTVATLNGDLTFAQLGFEYEYALRDWLSVWGELELAARVGTNAGSLLSSGVTLATGFGLGWLAQLRETDRSLLSAVIFLHNSQYTLVDLTNWVEELSNGNVGNLVVNTPTMRAGGGLSYAWALNDLIGFIFSGDATYGESFSREDDRFYFSGAAAMSLNLNERTNVPLGVALTLRADSHPSVNGEQTEGWEAVGLRFSYTGRDDLLLSLNTVGQRVPHREDDEFTAALVSFEIQYFF